MNSHHQWYQYEQLGYSTVPISQGLSTDFCKGQLTDICPKNRGSTLNCKLFFTMHPTVRRQGPGKVAGGWKQVYLH